MTFRALIEVWPTDVGIYIHELPGVYASGPTTAAALEALPDVVEHHLAWLASHGFDAGGAPLEIAIAEERAAVDGRYGPLFDADREPATADAVERALQVANLARRDLIDLYRAVSDVRRTRRPDGGWSMADHLVHVVEMERFYVGTLPWCATATLPADPVRALQASALLVESTLSEIPDGSRSEVFAHAGEQWTVAKVTRRMTAHLREHLPWLRQLARL